MGAKGSGKRRTDVERAIYAAMRFREGIGQSAACRRLGASPSWGRKMEREWEDAPEELARLLELHEHMGLVEVTDPKPREELSALALRCLDDFELFRVTVFGRRSLPWAVEAMHKVAELYESDRREYAAVNVAPGAGKTTIFSLDGAAWLTCRNRAIRGVLGSVIDTVSGLNLVQLRTEFERTDPLRATAEDMDVRGMVDAEYTMSQLYGRFKPAMRADGRWSSTGFDVEQIAGHRTAKKEHTWSIASMEGRFISVRCDYQCWDDPQSPESFTTEANRTKHETKLDNTIEARLDPGGLLLIVSQRLHQLDLSRYAIDKVIDIPTREGPVRRKKYTHIIYPAHFLDKCQGDHGEWSTGDDGEDVFIRPPAWPNGCLLDPGSLPFADLESMRSDNSHRFELVYQQNDASHNRSLVQPIWVSGGRDPLTGIEYFGCWDDDRPMRVIPAELRGDDVGRVYSYATVDPSVSQWWCIQWWLMHPATERRYLVDMVRKQMPASEFFELQPGTFNYSGIIDDWQARSREWGFPISHWVVEANAQQKHMVSDIALRTWAQQRGPSIISHQTQKNKSDGRLGVEALIPRLYKHGLLRLPGTHDARMEVRPLVDEATSWPFNQTTDTVMAQWFGEFNLETIKANADPPDPQYEWRPTWMRPPDDPTAYAGERLAAAFGGAA